MSSKNKTTQSRFSDEYWLKNYSEPEEMDGIANCREHALYLKSFLDLEQIHVESILDLGCGLGFLVEAIAKELKAKSVLAIEPAEFAFQKTKKRFEKLSIQNITTLKNWDLVTWAKFPYKKKIIYGLGICTSVFQYLSEEEIDLVLPVMSQRINYIYFSVPTNIELGRQRGELGYHDQFAYRRSRAWYLKKLKPHFTIVSNRILESKYFFDEHNTPSSELMFRF